MVIMQLDNFAGVLGKIADGCLAALPALGWQSRDSSQVIRLDACAIIPRNNPAVPKIRSIRLAILPVLSVSWLL